MECLLCGDGIDYKRTTCADCLASTVLEKRKQLQQLRDDCEPLRTDIRESLEKLRPAMKEKMENDMRAARINLLKEKIAFVKQCMEEDKRNAEQMDAKLQAKCEALQAARAKLEAFKAQLPSLVQPPTKSIEELQATCERTKSEVATHRRALITELLTLFPINPSPTSENDSLIINIILPNNGIYTSYPPDTLSAALGYVAHVVYLLSSYLGVVLPHPIDFAGSRSAIRTNDEPPRSFPLYGTRASDMEIGTKLLNNDIVYLCHTQGIFIPRSSYGHTLPNLMTLFRSPTLGWPGPHEWSSPQLPLRKPRPLLRVQRSNSTTLEEDEDDKQKASAEEQDDDDFILLADTVIPTPSQSEELAHFERALFIDNTS